MVNCDGRSRRSMRSKWFRVKSCVMTILSEDAFDARETKTKCTRENKRNNQKLPERNAKMWHWTLVQAYQVLAATKNPTNWYSMRVRSIPFHLCKCITSIYWIRCDPYVHNCPFTFTSPYKMRKVLENHRLFLLLPATQSIFKDCCMHRTHTVHGNMCNSRHTHTHTHDVRSWRRRRIVAPQLYAQLMKWARTMNERAICA